MSSRAPPSLFLALAASAFLLGACPKTPRLSRRGAPIAVGRVSRGVASWYGPRHHGQPTASGEPFDMNGLTAAHRRYRFGTWVRVTRTSNMKSVVVRINDRGPYRRGALIDLSMEAARRLDMLGAGRAAVECEVVAPPLPHNP